MPESKHRKKRPKRTLPPPPTPKKEKGPSPTWYVVAMFGLLGLGALVIILNYVTILPGSPTNLYLFGGLAGIAVGFAMTTQYR